MNFKRIAAMLLAAACASTSFANPLSGLLERTIEKQVSKYVGDWTSPLPSITADLPPAGSFASCKTLFPAGYPLETGSLDGKWRATALCSAHFAVVHSGLTKTPLVVIERLSRQQLNDALDEQRTDEFFADPRLPGRDRAELEDYRGSGFDRGHLAPAGDQPNQTSMAQSFALSNIVPQDPENNRKAWAKIESDVRKYARRASGNVFVYSGPMFREPRRTIGRNAVWVPSHLFKLVYDEATGRSWAYILANTANARVEAPIGYAEFVKSTGWQLLPPSALAAAR